MNNFSFYTAVWIIALAIASAALFKFQIIDHQSQLALSLNTLNIFRTPEPIEKELVLSQEELVDLVRPSVVRIAAHIKGEAEIPAFKIDLKKFTIAVDSSKKPEKISIDDYGVGSGFVVNPDGFIMTNAHLASKLSVKYVLVKYGLNLNFPSIGIAFLDAVVALQKEKLTPQERDRRDYLVNKNRKEELTPAESDEFSALDKKMELTSEENNELERAIKEKRFDEKIVEFAVEKVKYEASHELVVLNPKSSQKTLIDLMQDGFPAKLIKANENFIFDEKDIALIQIDKNNLPSLAVAPSVLKDSGQKIAVFGFPASADYSYKSFLSGTFTQGLISARKDTTKGYFKMIQTDAKVSDGSSGSPLLNDKGEVLGVVTQTSGGGFSVVDQFAFAIPMEIANEILQSANIAPSSVGYYDSFKSGLFNLHNRRCQKAVSDFNRAKEANENFIDKSRIDSYIEKCNVLIAAGNSIDGRWGEIKENLKEIGWGGFAIAGIIILLISGGGVAGFVLIRKIRREEKEIQDLEKFINLEDGVMHPNGVGSGALADKKTADAAASSPGAVQPIHFTVGPQASSSPAELSLTPKFAEEAKAQGVGEIKKTENEELLKTDDALKQYVKVKTEIKDGEELLNVKDTLKQYVKDARQAGMDNEAIKQELKKVGWLDYEIERALKT